MSEGSGGTERAGGAERRQVVVGECRVSANAAVLQLLQGEHLETVSRGLGVTLAYRSRSKQGLLG